MHSMYSMVFYVERVEPTIAGVYIERQASKQGGTEGIEGVHTSTTQTYRPHSMLSIMLVANLLPSGRRIRSFVLVPCHVTEL